MKVLGGTREGYDTGLDTLAVILVGVNAPCSSLGLSNNHPIPDIVLAVACFLRHCSHLGRHCHSHDLVVSAGGRIEMEIQGSPTPLLSSN